MENSKAHFGKDLADPLVSKAFIYRIAKVDVVGIEMQNRVFQVFHFPLGNTTQGTSLLQKSFRQSSGFWASERFQASTSYYMGGRVIELY